MRQVTFLFLFWVTSTLLVLAQSSFEVNIDWVENKILNHEQGPIEVLNFEGAYYDLQQHKLPIYKRKIRLPENTTEAQVNLFVSESRSLSDVEKQMCANVNFRFLTWRIVHESKIPYLIVSVIPFNSNSKITSFRYDVELEYEEYQLRSSDSELNSVFEDGEWYQLKVNKDGVYKIDKYFLESMGLDVSSIDPRKIQMYGNGGAMLPEYNATYRYESIQENAIYIHGDSDGTFDAEDFILFYGESPNRWVLNDNQDFEHVQNIYDTNNYYYLTVGSTNGKRVEIENVAETENHQVDFYTAKQFYEWEDQNLKHTGREWFGEYFSFSEVYNFNFNFSNRKTDLPIRINARAVARSSSQTELEFFHKGAEVLSLSIAPQTNPEIYVAEAEMESDFISSDEFIELAVSYNRNGNSSAFAYLDYIEMQASCAIEYTGTPLIISEPSTVGDDKVTAFDIQSNVNDLVVWDVSSSIEVKELLIEESKFKAKTDTLKTFVIHSPSHSNYLSPIFVKQIENQDLIDDQPANLIIVTAPEFNEAAQRLAEFHRMDDGLTVNVVSTEQLYHEFSSGKQDLIAIRTYLRLLYEKATSADEIPENVLLFGDASFDYKEIGVQANRYSNQNFVPTFESQYSFKLGPSYCTDDFIAFLDPLEGAQSTIGHDGLDMGVGRLVVQNLTEAHQVVDKIIHYKSSNSLGGWRSNICFVADDIDDENWEFRLQENMDKIAQKIDTNYHNYNINKIYLDAYPQISSAGGQRYPDARQAIVDNVNKGTLIMHYYGHGGEVGWAEERVLELSDINAWQNLDNLPVFITATCEFSRYDDAQRVSAGEQILLNEQGAGIALFTTTRTITESDAKNLSTAFYEYAIPESHGSNLSFGQIMKNLKNDLSSSPNKLKFTLIGDPALRLPIPEQQIIVTELLDANTLQPIDSIQALSKVIVRGSVLDVNGEKDLTFNGSLKPKVYDKPSKLQTLNNDFDFLDPFEFELQQNILYSGNITVTEGEFVFEFVVPKDIAYANGFGKFSFYAQNDSVDAIGAFVDFVIGGYNQDAEEDFIGPEVELYMNSEDFKSGGITDSGPSLYALVYDESGINTTGTGIGHDIVATLNEDSQNSIVLNHYYESDLDSYKSGSVLYPFSDLEEGLHTLKIKVWDVHNNSSEAFTEFLVVNQEGLVLKNLMNYPNPFSDYTQIHFEHNMSESDLLVRIDIFSMNGEIVKSMEQKISNSSYANSDFRWYGDSDTGAYLTSGIYICKVTVQSLNSDQEEVINSQMVLIK